MAMSGSMGLMAGTVALDLTVEDGVDYVGNWVRRKFFYCASEG